MNNIMELFINKKIGVLCHTEKAQKKFLEMCDEYKLRWASGDKASNFIWMTNYCVVLGFGFSENMTQTTPEDCKDAGREVIEFF